MNTPIRPLPREAAPQRTESGANPTGKTDSPGFGDLLNAQLDAGTPQTSEKPAARQEPRRGKPDEKQPDLAMGGLAQVTALPPPPVVLCGPDGTTITVNRSPNAIISASPGVLPSSELKLPTAGESPARPQANSNAGESTEKPPLDKGSAPDISLLDQLKAPLEQQLAPQGEAPAPIPDLPESNPALELKSAENANSPVDDARKLHGTPDAKQATVLLNIENFSGPGSAEQQKASVTLGRTDIAEVTISSVRGSAKRSELFPDSAVEKLPVQPEAFRAAYNSAAPTAPGVAAETSLKAINVIDSIWDQVQIFRASHETELRVVLRPDAQTELHLQVRKVDGQIHLEARCERGDFSWLDSQWASIQNALKIQGVQAATLQGPGRGTSDSTFMFSQDRGSQGERRSGMNFFPEQDSFNPRKPTSSTKSAASRPRGWQTWA